MALVRCKKGWTHQIGEVTAFDHSAGLLEGTIDSKGGCLKHNATDLSLNQVGNIASLKHTLAINGTCFDCPVVVDAVENSTSLRATSSSSLKDSGQYSLKNACTSSPGEESEAMRKWKEMKQNGFLSHPNGGVPMPEPEHGKRSKRKKGIDQKKKIEASKETHDNRRMETMKARWGQESRKMEITKLTQENRKMEMPTECQGKRKMETVEGELDNVLKSAPSSGLLSRISTGIIRRVKDFEEVHAILEDMVRLEKSDCQVQNEFIIQEESGDKKSTYETKYQSPLI